MTAKIYSLEAEKLHRQGNKELLKASTEFMKAAHLLSNVLGALWRIERQRRGKSKHMERVIKKHDELSEHYTKCSERLAAVISKTNLLM